MNQSLSPLDCWFLVGPTASGKTEVGVHLARQLGAEIISLDSMAIYRGMDIGTAKPTLEQRAAVPHHLIDIVEPDQEYSVARYVEEAGQLISEIRQRDHEVLFVGGTSLYLKSLLRGLFKGPPADWDFRREIEEELATVGNQALHDRLRQVDPITAARLHPNDVRRLIRALEVYTLTGQPISHLQMQHEEGRAAEACRVFVLDRSREELHDRIDQRVDQMFAAGLVEEVERLTGSGKSLGQTARQAVGYCEVLEHLADRCDLDDAIQQTKTRTRQFAKRQGTWFRGLSECRMVGVAEEDSATAITERIYQEGRDIQAS